MEQRCDGLFFNSCSLALYLQSLRVLVQFFLRRLQRELNEKVYLRATVLDLRDVGESVKNGTVVLRSTRWISLMQW